MKPRRRFDGEHYEPTFEESHEPRQMLTVTEISIVPFFGPHESNFLGYASITLNDCLVIRGIRICKGRYGMFVAWPKQQGKARGGESPEWFNTVFPITRTFFHYTKGKILQVYKEGNYA